jgi:S1-C subfamily serine protease
LPVPPSGVEPTVLGYQDGEAAGTGMVLTSDGEVLTFNHVVEGATSITVLGTGQSYATSVVGTDPTDDVAVLQLDAAGLDTVQADDDTVTTGAPVTAVGNAGDEAGNANIHLGYPASLGISVQATVTLATGPAD